MISRIALITLAGLQLAACADFPARRPVINSASYDWTDQVRDAQGFPLPGWGDVIAPNGGSGSM
ncbi:MAG TPA: hypothetical protein VJR47_22340 [Stellaceae bacterium]|nr:hypothetical protein [Stellaceae bacterium]